MTKPLRDVVNLGQVFTPEAVVNAMLALRQNKGRVLEPSAGDGAFSQRLPGCVAVELDPKQAPDGAWIGDFFSYPVTEQFDTIIGNPPYVRFQDIHSETRALLPLERFDARSNLYLFFIEKAIRHLLPGGELIFITPRDFLKTTSSVKLNAWLYSQGSITHAIELGDARVWSDALPNCLIWRFEKGRGERAMVYAEIGYKSDWDADLKRPPWQTRYFLESAGHLMFTRGEYSLKVSDVFSVKVGGVSGADDIYTQREHGNREFVCSETFKTGQTRTMIWQQESPHPALLAHKERLLARRVARFDETNWWQWGRGYPQTDHPRIYVNGRTRQTKPFFLHPCNHFDGAILALFPHQLDLDLQQVCKALNELNWSDLGFVCDGRFIFTQRSLENAPLPESFRPFLSKSLSPPSE